uniref:Uncharacterized protein n=1 Tax=Nelumbo nucifera TaxID=4432 RepID=A0A822ZAV3_NELNU|nr:TPA_asm: hypothetical protein HUJ06_014902 [Nelumbo nucifera]
MYNNGKSSNFLLTKWGEHPPPTILQPYIRNIFLFY